MNTYHVRHGSILPLGKQGENMARKIQFDISRWIGTFGPGTVQLLHQRSGDNAPYPVAVEKDGTQAIWTVTNADTAAAGTGRAELQYYVGDALVKSETWMTKVLPALGDASETPPEAQQGWVDQVLQAGAAATEAAEKAVNAAVRQPIVGGNGNWWTWDLEAGAYVDTGIYSGGDAPYIGDNGNWYVGQTDTGVAATGPAGPAGPALAVTNTAAVGQTIKITAVGENGQPTEWEAVDMAGGGGGTGGGGDVFELIGEATSSGVSDVVGLTIPFDGSLYKTIIAYAYNLPAGNKKRIIIRKKKEWYDGSPLGWNTVADSYLNSMTNMSNTWGFFGAAIDVDGKLFTFGAAESNANGGHGFFRFFPQNGALPTLNLSDCKFISLDCNSNSEIIPDGCSLVVWGVRK